MDIRKGDDARQRPQLFPSETSHRSRDISVRNTRFSEFLDETPSLSQFNPPYGYGLAAQNTRFPLQVLTLRQSFEFDGFFQLRVWKHALLECWVMTMLVFTFGLLAAELTAMATDGTASVLVVALLGSLFNALTLPLFIWAAAPDSGGHINPFITMSTFFARLTTFPQTVLYILGQSLGSVIGGYLLKVSLRDDYFPGGIIPGCTFDNAQITVGQAFTLETFSAMALIFSAFGVGLDPRQATVFGPVLGPALVGLALAIISLSSMFVKPGYTGSSLNPGRCLGLMVPTGNMAHHWIHWLADLTAALVNGFMYWYIPSYENRPRL